MNEQATADPSHKLPRISSLDQFRGYTVVGMILVNFIGGYVVVPPVLKHHNTYCSYADTIMPQFFFAVGFAFRLTFLKRLAREGAFTAVLAAIRRNLGLILIGFVVYHLDGGAKTWESLRALGLWGFLSTAFQKDVFQTLVHIALASIWVLPVIAARPSARVAYMVASGLLHLGLSWWFYFDWAWQRKIIDGGPLGFISWSIPLLVGSLAYDTVAKDGRAAIGRMLGWSLVLMVVGYAVSCVGVFPAAPPFTPPDTPVTVWTMSQRSGSLSYLTFAAGFSLAVYALFVALCDRPRGLDVGVFRTFGTNALAAYVLHDLVSGAVAPWVPKDAPGWYLTAGFLVYFGITYLFIRHLEKHGLFLRL